MNILIADATIVNEGRSFKGSVVIDGDAIRQVTERPLAHEGYDRVIDARDCVVMPGVIDTHVHFREPGLTHKADIGSESQAAALGGVTSFFDMPNTVPQTMSREALEEKWRIASETSHVNHAFFFGATNDNIDSIPQDDPRVPGIKLFMGSSTGNMLVDDDHTLRRLFRNATLPIMAHCEDTAIINRNMAEARRWWGDDPDVVHHPEIRSREACVASTTLAVNLAREYGTRLHVAHLSTADELALFPPTTDGAMPRITAEAVLAHLLFTDDDYASKGTWVKCNPSVKTMADRNALRQALTDGRIFTVATDHAPHTLAEKEGGCAKAASGMPMVQFSLVSMLDLVDQGVLSLERLVELMCHHPARLFDIHRRGFLRPGYKADITIVRRQPWTLRQSDIASKCGWNPLLGQHFGWRVAHTFCNGAHIVDEGRFQPASRGEQLLFRMP
ncbi:MAG: dihydroorotase [Prevotella sp.]|nr:dihydroorotase [Prevotella sp.]